MQMKKLKVPLSCRVYPQLKKVVEEEAIQEEQTTSLYLESIIQNRHQKNEVNVVDLMDEIEDLQEEITELKAALNSQRVEEIIEGQSDDFLNWEEEENEESSAYFELQEDHRLLQNEHQRQTAELEATRTELHQIRENVLDTFTEEQREELQNYLTKLQDKYPDHDEDEIILACLYTTIKNEKAIWNIHTLDFYFNHFKKLVA